jgi:uroporphyrinogen decarboxylase
MLTERERFIAALTFQKPDRVPFCPGDGRESTLAAWHRQGLPAEVTDYHAYVRQLLGLPDGVVSSEPRLAIGVDFRMIPQFEEKVIEDRGGTRIVQDWKGNICEISKQYDVRYLRDPIDFVTRRWIRCPVAGRDDWHQMRRRYRPEEPGRFPDDFQDRARRLRDRSYPSGIVFSGPFWQLREWLGFEELCMLLMDDPGLVEEMIDFWEQFVAEVLDRVLGCYLPDYVVIAEDMAYKGRPMVGPDQCRRFLLRCWRRWGQACRQAGVPICGIDSDGHVGQLIPVWIEAGLNFNSPQEAAAGNDLPGYRRTFGMRMAYQGGVDKRAIAAGGGALRNEIGRLRPVIAAGGYIPSCDHGVPADVPWPHFVEYCRLLAEATSWI